MPAAFAFYMKTAAFALWSLFAFTANWEMAAESGRKRLYESNNHRKQALEFRRNFFETIIEINKKAMAYLFDRIYSAHCIDCTGYVQPSSSREYH